jgi:hypothetical protein
MCDYSAQVDLVASGVIVTALFWAGIEAMLYKFRSESNDDSEDSDDDSDDSEDSDEKD